MKQTLINILSFDVLKNTVDREKAKVYFEKLKANTFQGKHQST
jgi:hypothetical protein